MIVDFAFFSQMLSERFSIVLSQYWNGAFLWIPVIWGMILHILMCPSFRKWMFRLIFFSYTNNNDDQAFIMLNTSFHSCFFDQLINFDIVMQETMTLNYLLIYSKFKMFLHRKFTSKTFLCMPSKKKNRQSIQKIYKRASR